jgi:hypothetical protein
MAYRDVWGPELGWLEVFLLCRLSGFDERTARYFIDQGVPHGIVLERFQTALHHLQ